MQRPPRYDGEDTSPTSRKELMGWYAYGLAAEVFAVCGIGAYCFSFNHNCICYESANAPEQVRFFRLP
jgi:Vacuole effluxer Atg22 like